MTIVRHASENFFQFFMFYFFIFRLWKPIVTTSDPQEGRKDTYLFNYILYQTGIGHPASRQVSFSDTTSRTSESDLNISQLLQNSDRDLDISSSAAFESGKDAESRHCHTSGASVPDDSNIGRNHINQQILTHLSALGERLSNIENLKLRNWKKTKDNYKIKSSNRFRKLNL